MTRKKTQAKSNLFFHIRLKFNTQKKSLCAKYKTEQLKRKFFGKRYENPSANPHKKRNGMNLGFFRLKYFWNKLTFFVKQKFHHFFFCNKISEMLLAFPFVERTNIRVPERSTKKILRDVLHKLFLDFFFYRTEVYFGKEIHKGF